MRKTVLITVNGTGSPDPFGFGFDSSVGSSVANPWYNIATQTWGEYADVIAWQPISYPAAIFPMGPSVAAGVTEALRQIDLYADFNIILCGYSQGALVTDITWRDHLLTGDHQARMGDVIGIVNFGDPMRCPGICNGNVYAGFPLPVALDGFTTGGVSGTGDLTKDQTPDFLMSCNNDGDLYGSAPVGDNPWTAISAVGADEQLVFDLVQNFDGTSVTAFVEKAMSLLAVAPTVFSLPELIKIIGAMVTGLTGSSSTGSILSLIPSTGVQTPDQVVSLIQALLNGGMFFINAQGPHLDYQKMVPQMTNWVIERAYAFAH